MLVFGAGKIFTVQFPPPNLYKLQQPYGDFSPMSLLWTFMGASHHYSVLTGWVQVLGGVLLFIPRLTTLGALVSIAVSANIFALNLFCDVPVKLYSLHLLLFSLFLVLPDAQRLINLFLLNRAVEASSEAGLFRQRRLNTAALLAQVTLGAILFCSFFYQAHKYEIEHFGSVTRPPFYGIWTVDEFTLHSKSLAPPSMAASISLRPMCWKLARSSSLVNSVNRPSMRAWRCSGVKGRSVLVSASGSNTA